MKALAWLVIIAAVMAVFSGTVGCSSVPQLDRAERVRLAIDGARAACLLYDAELSSVPRTPELDAVCPILLGKRAPVDAGTEGGDGG